VFETQIPVQVSRMMLVDDEAVAGAGLGGGAPPRALTTAFGDCRLRRAPRYAF
jgi:hypothetical protein